MYNTEHDALYKKSIPINLEFITYKYVQKKSKWFITQHKIYFYINMRF